MPPGECHALGVVCVLNIQVVTVCLFIQRGSAGEGQLGVPGTWSDGAAGQIAGEVPS